MTNRESVEKQPVKLEDVTKPVTDTEWGQSLFDCALSDFSKSVLMEDPSELNISLITRFESDHAGKFSDDKVTLISYALKQLRDEYFSESATFTTGKIRVKRHSIFVGLQSTEPLHRERRAVLSLLQLVTHREFPNPDNYFFNLRIGALANPDEAVKVIHGLTDSGIPNTVTLGQSQEHFTKFE